MRLRIASVAHHYWMRRRNLLPCSPMAQYRPSRVMPISRASCIMPRTRAMLPKALVSRASASGLRPYRLVGRRPLQRIDA